MPAVIFQRALQELQTAGIESQANPGSAGTAGDPLVNAGAFAFLPAVIFGIESQANPGSAGTAGDLTVNAGALSINNNGQLGTPTFGAGNGGTTTVNVSQTLTLSGPLTGINASAGAGSSGRAGQIAVTAGGAVAFSDGAGIISGTAGAGDGGSIQVTAQGPLTMTGPATGIGALATSTASGNAGPISVSAPQITLSDNAGISSLTEGTGTGGNVTVKTPGALTLNGGATIGVSTLGMQSGQAGSVTVVANALTISGGGAVKPVGQNMEEKAASHIASATIGPGNGGNVDVVVASDIVLTGPGPQILALSQGSGSAGSVTVSAGRLLLANGASISASAATSKASGGNITLTVGDLLNLVNSKINTSVQSTGTGNGGNITIDPQSVVLDQSSIIAQAVQGHGGSITINANQFLQSADSFVSASSALGISGTIEIIGPRVDFNGALVTLPGTLRSPAAILREGCAAQSVQPRSSLLVQAPGRLAQDPEMTLRAFYLGGEERPPAAVIAASSDGAGPSLASGLHFASRCE
jgi:large exoprotein involved in heme utilization and adhesion